MKTSSNIKNALDAYKSFIAVYKMVLKFLKTLIANQNYKTNCKILLSCSNSLICWKINYIYLLSKISASLNLISLSYKIALNYKMKSYR